MAAVSFQLAPVQSNLGATPFPPPDAEVTDTPVNANQAQGAPVPLDTVTLAAQTAQGQGTGQNQQDSQFQSSPGFAVAAALFANASPATSPNGNTAGKTQAAPGSGNSTNAQSLLADTANTGLQQATATTQSQPDPAQTQEQELQQLDETLRQLGIDPQSISVFNQLAMLAYANNPSALQQFVQQFQVAATLQQGGAASGATSQNASQTLTSNASVDATASAAQDANGAAQTDAAPANPSSTAALQFQELQSAVAAVGGQVQLPSSTSAPNPPHTSLDVTT